MAKKKQKNKTSPVITIILILLAMLIAFSCFKIVDALFSPHKVEQTISDSPSTIKYNGKEYYPRQDVTVIMLMGIDEYGPVKESVSYNNTGEADMVALAVFDEKDKTYSVLVLNRDTMMDIPVLGLGGRTAGTAFEQLALAHTYGTGLKDSCENTVTAVSNFMSGMTIDYYISMNMDAISILNDAVGGVTVNVQDDFSEVDPTIKKGEVKLNGEQALSYVHTRKDVGNQMNISRMDRHKEYMENFVEAFKAKVEEDDMFTVDIYEEVASYLVSDCSVNTLSSMLSRYSEFELRDIVTPKGENIMSEQYMEFHVDKESLQKLVIDMFYTQI